MDSLPIASGYFLGGAHSFFGKDLPTSPFEPRPLRHHRFMMVTVDDERSTMTQDL